nr:hypothetical protein [Tanacetum cinerariifolium]
AGHDGELERGARSHRVGEGRSWGIIRSRHDGGVQVHAASSGRSRGYARGGSVGQRVGFAGRRYRGRNVGERRGRHGQRDAIVHVGPAGQAHHGREGHRCVGAVVGEGATIADVEAGEHARNYHRLGGAGGHAGAGVFGEYA